MTSHLHSNLTRCTDSPRPPGVDPHPPHSKHAQSLLIMRRHTPSHEEGPASHSRSLSLGSSTICGVPFTSRSLWKQRDAHSYARFWARRSFGDPKSVPRGPAKAKHFAIPENIHLDYLLKRRPATPHHSDGRAPPGVVSTLSKKRRTTSDSSVLLDLDRHRRTIGERKQIKRQRQAKLVSLLVRVRRQSPLERSKNLYDYNPN